MCVFEKIVVIDGFIGKFCVQLNNIWFIIMILMIFNDRFDRNVNFFFLKVVNLQKLIQYCLYVFVVDVCKFCVIYSEFVKDFLFYIYLVYCSYFVIKEDFNF